MFSGSREGQKGLDLQLKLSHGSLDRCMALIRQERNGIFANHKICSLLMSAYIRPMAGYSHHHAITSITTRNTS